MGDEGVAHEALDVETAADGGPHLGQLPAHLVHLDGLLGEHGARAFLPVGGRLPLAVDVVALPLGEILRDSSMS